MVEVLMNLQLPGDVEGYVYRLCTDGHGRCHVALQRVAHHEQLVRLDVQMPA